MATGNSKKRQQHPKMRMPQPLSRNKNQHAPYLRNPLQKHRISSSPDWRFTGTAQPSQVSPMTDFRQMQSLHAYSGGTVGIFTRFSILSWACYRTHKHSYGYLLVYKIPPLSQKVNRKIEVILSIIMHKDCEKGNRVL